MLETPRLTLRELESGDLPFLGALLGDRAVMRFFGAGPAGPDPEMWLQRQRERYVSHGYGYWMATERDTGARVGQAGLVPVPGGCGDEPSLGYILARSFQGRGLATEAAAASCRFAFDRLGVPRVTTLVRPQNSRSRRVAERLGMRRAGARMFAGFEHFIYRILRADRAGAERHLIR